VLDLDCSDPKQIHATQRDFETINHLLNTNICPSNVALVQNSHINETDSQQIGLCPFELVFNHDDGRNPARFVEAKCTKCLHERCSTLGKCEEVTQPMTVTYLKDNRNENISRSIGCFCTSRRSTLLSTITPP